MDLREAAALDVSSKPPTDLVEPIPLRLGASGTQLQPARGRLGVLQPCREGAGLTPKPIPLGKASAEVAKQDGVPLDAAEGHLVDAFLKAEGGQSLVPFLFGREQSVGPFVEALGAHLQ